MPVCPSCAEENPERARFCLACGALLAAEPAPAREVRKTVTIVFCDVTGSTPLGERLDPESLRRVLQRYYDEMRGVVERHGGTVEKFIGDAVMAVFGIPALHEDDALRAVRAASEMQQALAALNRELERERGVTIAIRTGVNTGEVVAGDPAAGQALVTGDAVNVAARLEQAAEPGEILIGEPTLRLVRGAVVAEPARRLDLKGKAKPVGAFRLLSVTPGAPAFARRLDSPLVGRGHERALLEEAFEHAVREGACHLFTLLGPAGVGKSRLVLELLTDVGDRAVVLQGRCLPYGDGITFWPVAEVVRHAAGIDESDSPEQALAKIAALLAEEQDGTLVTERIASLLGLSEVVAPAEETLWAVRKLLEVVARARPLVVVFDDLEWGEPAFLDLVEHVADWSRDAPMLLLCLARPELLDRRPGWGGGKLNATSILLEPLTEGECEQLIENLLGRVGLDAEARHRIAEAAGGNPLFVEEMVAMLIDDGLLRRENGRWAAAGDLAEIAVPPSIQALLAARLDRLDGEERQVLERGSVVGKVFHRSAVAELVPEPVRSRVGATLMALVRKELIRPDRSTLPGDDAFRFRHTLVRDAAYQALPKEMRADLHQRFARWLEHAAGVRLAEIEEILGYHLEQAYRYRSELGPPGEPERELAACAAERLGSAGHRAYTRGDVRAAAKLLTRAESLMSPEDIGRLRLLLDLGLALHDVGELERAASVLADAAERAEKAGDRVIVSRARLHEAHVRTFTDPEGATEALALEAERALPIFREAGDEAGMAFAYSDLSTVHWSECRAERAEELTRLALEHARRAGDDVAAPHLHVWLAAQAFFGPTPVEEGIRRCEDILTRSGLKRVEGAALEITGAFLAMQSRFEEARELAARATAIQEDLGLRVHVAAAHFTGTIELLAGNPAGAERLLGPGCEELTKMGERAYMSTTAALLAEALYRLGRDDEALAATRASEEAAASNDISAQMAWRGVRAKVVARRGDLEQAEALARVAVDFAERTDFIDMHGDTIGDLAEVLALAGRPGEATAALGEALALYERKGNLVSAGRARARLAELAT